MLHDGLTFTIFLIFTGTAIFATLALFARQMLIVAYIVIGILLGPAGFSVITNAEQISQISSIGITFLLFLLGIDLSPVKLIKLLRSASLITGLSSAVFGVVGFIFGKLYGLDSINSLVLGTTLMFSSTIIGLKLLPTTILHHKPTGEAIISILLLQDIIAITALLFMHGIAAQETIGQNLIIITVRTLIYLPLLIAISWVFYKFVISHLMRRFGILREYIFLLAIGWCLGIAEFAAYLDLSHEIGAFIAGIILAASPIATYITESLKPIRDFFLIIFFFSLGASVETTNLQQVIIPAAILALIILLIKPIVLYRTSLLFGQEKERSKEVSVRLGQGSEFSLLIGALALELKLISTITSSLIQITMLITFIISSYLIMLRYPTPISLSEKLRRD